MIEIPTAVSHDVRTKLLPNNALEHVPVLGPSCGGPPNRNGKISSAGSRNGRYRQMRLLRFPRKTPRCRPLYRRTVASQMKRRESQIRSITPRRELRWRLSPRGSIEGTGSCDGPPSREGRHPNPQTISPGRALTSERLFTRPGTSASPWTDSGISVQGPQSFETRRSSAMRTSGRACESFVAPGMHRPDACRSIPMCPSAPRHSTVPVGPHRLTARYPTRSECNDCLRNRAAIVNRCPDSFVKVIRSTRDRQRNGGPRYRQTQHT